MCPESSTPLSSSDKTRSLVAFTSNSGPELREWSLFLSHLRRLQLADQMPLFSNILAVSLASMSRFGFSSKNVVGRVQECRLDLMMTSRLPLDISNTTFSDSTRSDKQIQRWRRTPPSWSSYFGDHSNEVFHTPARAKLGQDHIRKLSQNLANTAWHLSRYVPPLFVQHSLDLSSL